jgi:DNA-binding MarR family transcriptional regulator
LSNTQTDFIRELSELAFASRLKRLRDSLLSDVGKIYRSQNINFEPRWFPIFYLLKDYEQLTIGDITQHLGISQPAVSQLVEMMSDKGLIIVHGDKKDTRKKLISLSGKAKELIPNLMPIWDDIRFATRDLFEKTGIDVLLAIDKIEDELSARDMYSRVEERIKERYRNDVRIIGYDAKYQAIFKKLNYEWLKKYFKIELEDEKILNDPENQILNKGGEIYFAEINKQIVGTGALIKCDEVTDELIKMAVTEKSRGKQAGRMLAEHLINRARIRNSAKIVLETSPKLTAAMNLYRNLGFIHVPVPGGESQKYKRFTIKMELKLN